MKKGWFVGNFKPSILKTKNLKLPYINTKLAS